METKKELMDAIIDLLGVNDILVDALEELDNYNGYLGDDRYYPMYEFDEIMDGNTPTEIAKLVGDSSRVFDINEDYFRFTIWGLESAVEPDYDAYLDEDLVESLVDNIGHIELNEELKELLKRYDEAEDEEEEE